MQRFFDQLKRKWFFSFLYRRRPPWDTGITPPEVAAFVSAHPPGRALDLGCGTGTNAIYLAQRGWQVTGVDFIAKAIRQAKDKARQVGVQVDFRHGDVTRLEAIRGPFDLILDIGCFHSLTEAGKADYLDSLHRLLAPEGIFLLYAFIRPRTDDSGLSSQNLADLEARLRLEQRQDGEDRGRHSAWLTYQR